MPVGTSPTRNFATLGPLYLRPPFTGASATSFALRLTSCVNLPAPGRRQCVYVGLEYALAHTCVFAKQSLDAILCGRVGLGVRSEEHTSELQSRLHLVCRLLLEKK